MNSRAIATQALSEVLIQKQSLSEVLPKFKNLSKKPEDAAFIQNICFGVLRTYPRLKFIASQLLNQPLKAKDADILLLLCVGLYQLFILNTPSHAAISETVEASRQLKKPWASGLVNAVLRNALRGKQKFSEQIQSKTIPQDSEASYLHPKWLLQMLKKAWPLDFENIIAANNHQAPLVLRVNQQKISTEAYLEKLSGSNHPAKIVAGLETAIILDSACDVLTLPGFNEGLVSVQDAAAQIAAILLEAGSDMRILDACAAPGGKTAHILEKNSAIAELIALDIAEARCQKIKDNLTRLQLKASVICADANQVQSWWDGVLFDRILLDAPCSATGVIRRHPDIKFLRQATDIPKFAAKQLSLLKNLWPLLKPKGSLVYATCSILPEENNQLIKKFLELEPSAKIQTFSLPFGLALDFGQQILPGQNNMDGFYYARIRKESA